MSAVRVRIASYLLVFNALIQVREEDEEKEKEKKHSFFLHTFKYTLGAI